MIRKAVRMFSLLVAFLAASGSVSEAVQREPDAFPEPQGLEPRVRFWIDIYTRYTTRQAVLHDAEDPRIVYGVIDLGGEPDGGISESPETDTEIMELGRERVGAILMRFDRRQEDSASLSEEESLVRDAVAGLAGDDRFRVAAGRVRAQRGLADRFRLGLVRSGGYIEAFRELARDEGVPEDLAYLPHVESSFESVARSHVGAAGMWQFMRGTGRLFLTIDDTRDERLDPFLAARAAFQLLRENHAALGSWPLAITAYNHGRAGMLRAVRQHGSDLVTIVERHRSRTFGFASKSFYAEFIAACRIAREPEAWLGPILMDPPIAFDTFILPDYVAPATLGQEFDLVLADLRALNPALPASVWEGRRLAPRGYGMRFPVGTGARVQSAWASLPARFDRRLQNVWHRVRKGENLTIIARRYRTSVPRLRSLNGLRRGRFIHPGQRLRVNSTETWIPLHPDPPHTGLRGAVADLLRHVVRSGETLSSIGIRYGIRVAHLVQANGIVDPSRIHAGQVLLIPLAN